MTLSLADFLDTHGPVTAVNLRPSDASLVNVVIGDGQIFGVVTPPIPSGVVLTVLPATGDRTAITAGPYTFNPALYTMLGS